MGQCVNRGTHILHYDQGIINFSVINILLTFSRTHAEYIITLIRQLATPIGYSYKPAVDWTIRI